MGRAGPWPSRRSSVGVQPRPWLTVGAFGMTPVAIAPTAQISSTGKGNPCTPLPNEHSSPQPRLAAAATLRVAAVPRNHCRRRALPVQHHDVALVDASDILGPETTFDTTFFNELLGANGVEDQLYSSVQTALGTTDANLLLDTDGAMPVFSGVFNGAESRLSEGLFIDGLASEDQLNQLLGVTESASQTAILADLVDNPGPSIPADSGVTLAGLESAVGTSAFDTDLTSIANADYAFAMGDFQGYLADLPTNLERARLGRAPSILTTLLGDLTGGTAGDGLQRPHRRPWHVTHRSGQRSHLTTEQINSCSTISNSRSIYFSASKKPFEQHFCAQKRFERFRPFPHSPQTLSDSLITPENVQVSYGEGGAMAGRRSSVGFIRGCGGAFGMTPVAITPPAQIV